MKRVRCMIIALAIICLIAGCAQTGQMPSASSSPVMDRILSRAEVKVGMSGDMPPMNVLSKEEKIIGLDAGLLPALEAGSIDMIISNITMTPDRNLKVDFVGPYFTSGKAFLTVAGLLRNRWPDSVGIRNFAKDSIETLYFEEIMEDASMSNPS